MTTNDFNEFGVHIKVADVYQEPREIPDGYEVVSFRLPKSGDLWLAISGTIAVGNQDCRYVLPRLILRKVNKNKTFLLLELREEIDPADVLAVRLTAYPHDQKPERSIIAHRMNRVSARDAMDALKAFAAKMAEVKD